MKKKIFLLCLALGQLFLVLPSAIAARSNHPSQADTAKQCSICHYRWVYTFYVEHRDTPLAPLEEEKVVGSRDMCLSCHDGSVLDSRDRICNDPGHSVGNLPSNRVSIPDTFPLDKNGAMQCSTCHTPHAIETSKDTLVEFFLRAPNKDSSFCKQCHARNTGGTVQGNHPTEVSADKKYQSIIEAGGLFGTGKPNEIICETCHTPHGGVNNRRLILSVEDPKTRSVLCEVCHTTRPGLASDPSLNRFSHPLDLTPGLTVSVPQRWKDGATVVLGTGGELVCRTCHIPHGAVKSSSLLAQSNRRDSFCIQCHTNQASMKESIHYREIIKQDEKNIVGQRASEVGPCTPCHLVHQGTGKLMWARKEKISFDKPGEMCISCHVPEGSAAEVMPGEFSHPMDVSVPRSGGSLVLPLFDNEGMNMGGEIRCATCHDFHSPYSHNNPDTEEIKHASFLRLSKEGASGVCIACHPEQGWIRGTHHDLRITAPDFINREGRSLEQGGVCSPCHMAHRSKQQRYLWAAPLGPSRLESWESETTNEKTIMVQFCTGCHSPGGVAKSIPRFGLHPRKEMVGGSTQIDLQLVTNQFPLFTDDGGISGSGYIVCSTCHNPHHWDSRVQAEGSGQRGQMLKGNVADSFLRENLHTQFCTICHGEDTLIKFTYYHSPISRVKKK
jgi:predicted CXXCH cytochrome family protein